MHEGHAVFPFISPSRTSWGYQEKIIPVTYCLQRLQPLAHLLPVPGRAEKAAKASPDPRRSPPLTDPPVSAAFVQLGTWQGGKGRRRAPLSTALR